MHQQSQSPRRLYDFEPQRKTFRDEVMQGLQDSRKNCQVSTSTMTSVHSCSSRFVNWTSTTPRAPSSASCKRTCMR